MLYVEKQIRLGLSNLKSHSEMFIYHFLYLGFGRLGQPLPLHGVGNEVGIFVGLMSPRNSRFGLSHSFPLHRVGDKDGVGCMYVKE